MSRTAIRMIEMLRLIPREPRRISVGALGERLATLGHPTSARTIQRDLNTLSAHFPLVCDDRDHPYGWSWSRHAQARSLPGMDTPTALTFCMAETYLRDMLPASVVELMQPHFRQARETLEAAGNGLLAWEDKVRILPRHPPLLPPEVDPERMARVYEGLLRGRRLEVRYRPRSGEERAYYLSPQGLALRDAVIYLVASHRDYDDVVMFALHRFTAVTLTDEPARHLAGFDLDAWIARGGFDAHENDAPVGLVARFDADVGRHLLETPLSERQTVREAGDGRLEVTAPVKDTHQLRWWLRAFGPQVEVLEPAHLRREMAEAAEREARLYRRPRPEAG